MGLPNPERLSIQDIPGATGAEPISTRQVDRLDANGAVIGVSLITQTDWDTQIEHYDLSGTLVGRSFTSADGSSSEDSTWTPLVDEVGTIIGQRHQSRSRFLQSYGSGEPVVVTSEWILDTDLNGQLIASQYSSSDGSWEQTVRGPAPQAPIEGPAPLSHVLSTQGAWAGSGSFSRTEVYDVRGNLIQLRASYADGSSEAYDLIPVRSDEGQITGYAGTWSWTDTNGTTSNWSEQLDPNLRPLNGGGAVDVLAATETLERGLLPPLQADTDALIALTAVGEELEPVSHNAGQEAGNGLRSGTHSLRLNTAQHAAVTHARLTGDGNLNLRGNRLANVLIGNDGDNRIAGGRGLDVLTGRGGSDHFVLRAHPESTDTITDFNHRKDHLLLRGREFRELFRRDGQVRQGVLGDTLRFVAKQDALVWTPEAKDDSRTKPSVTLAILQGLARQDFSADLLTFA